MTAPPAMELLSEFLSVLERQELGLLTWGVVHGGFLQEELDDLAADFLAANPRFDVTREELLEVMRERRLIFNVGQADTPLFRSRMAEGVRLFANLRQILRNRPWRTAPTLVADFRFVIRPRTYPERRITREEALEAWAAAGLLSSAQRQRLEAGLSGDRAAIQLARFQVDATTRVLEDVRQTRSRGMIVTVGTGSGKTLAFYLPAMAHVATLVKDGEFWTKAIAIYPRNELLKDQFSEAYREVRRHDVEGRRKVTIATLFGFTPRVADPGELGRRKWRRSPSGFMCPFLRCPKCAQDLLWRHEDVTSRTERLSCSDPRCGTEVSGDEVLLTRERIQRTPPDVLFTTTETLNRRLSDTDSRRVFGIGVPRKPRFVLLDEVHTYVGTSGAQAALLIRRWRHLVAGPVQFTGLSATLRNAADFFSTLTGLPIGSIVEITPGALDLEAEGMEYMLALRADPASKTSTLSTSIQASMLLGRLLDARAEPRSDNFYGTKVFAFTDDLDVTNRFYHNLLDAEGWNGQGTRQTKPPLAAARSRVAPDHNARAAEGQSWRITEDIGHVDGLQRGLRIGRTSSQDTGVDSQSDVVVATASLEVGFNDPTVGAMLQHKAPLDVAAFLQRKGRAGRVRTMRPWSVVVLSDYGRDRLAYQAYDALFDPVLPARSLPTNNRYVLRIQAAYALMEWIAARLPHHAPSGSVFDDFSGPVSGPAHWAQDIQARQQLEIELLERLVSGDEALVTALRNFIASALAVSDDEADALLFEPPRAVLASVVPTILRRLKTRWTKVPLHAGDSATDFQQRGHPLPDFVPENLFSDLNLPEVTIHTGANRAAREDRLPILQAVNALTPGSVTRRFAVSEAQTSHWIPLPHLDLEQQQLNAETVCEAYDEIGLVQILENDALTPIRCLRPTVMRLTDVDSNRILPSSKARPIWRSQIFPSGDGVSFDLPDASPWERVLRGATFFVHNLGAGVEVRRFSVGSEATVLFRSGNELRATVRYTVGERSEPGAIGFTEAVDGLLFRCALPDDIGADLASANTPKTRALRTAYYRHRVLEDRTLKEHTNVFQRDRLQETYLSALTAWAFSTSSTLEVASRAMTPDIAVRAMEKVLAAIFRTLQQTDADDAGDNDDASDDPEDRQQKSHTELLALCADQRVLGALQRAARVLWAPTDAAFREWSRQRLKATIGGALLAACRELYPEGGAGDLILDIEGGPRPPGVAQAKTDEIWITETTLGGGGVVEEILRRFAEDPRRFFRLAEAALSASDFELIDGELTRILNLLPIDQELADSFAAVRNAEFDGHAALRAAVSRNIEELDKRAIQTSHSVIVALHARVLRPASASDSDMLLRDLINDWRISEERLGIEVDARVYAYLKCDVAALDAVLQRIAPGRGGDARQWRLQVILTLLWPRGHAVRGQALASYNPFVTLPEADRHLLQHILTAADSIVALSDPNWRALVAEGLRVRGAVRVVTSHRDAADLRTALLEVAATPVDVDYLQFYPQLDEVTRDADGLAAVLYLPESLQ
jgi:hypothetical protein